MTRKDRTDIYFCHNKGMILELSIDTSWIFYGRTGGRTSYRYQGLEQIEESGPSRFSCFDCDWISDYSNEHEIFCIGGLNKFVFETIIEAQMGIHYIQYIIGIKNMTNCMSSGDYPSIYKLPSNMSKNEKQMLFRLLSHQLYKYYPTHKQAHQFKSCPEYVRQILDEHCQSIQKIMFTENSFSSNIINGLFKYENGWIRLDLLMKIFPNTERILFNATKKHYSFIRNESIWSSIINYISLNKSTKLKYIEIFLIWEVCGDIDKDCLNQYRKAFHKTFWDLSIKYQEDTQSFLSNHAPGSGIIENKLSLILTNNIAKIEHSPGITTYYDRTKGFPF